ncbi:MAG: hypothetical protein AB4426_12440 [Xenococcaceae cyanobacterium]
MFSTTTIQELELQSVPGPSQSQLVFQNKLLTRGPDFSKNLREAAINFCQKYYSSKLLCLLVESQYYLTVWLENPETSISSELDKKSESQSPPVQKQSIKKYRGFSYEDGGELDKKSESQSPSVQISRQKQSSKKYRGVSYQ